MEHEGSLPHSQELATKGSVRFRGICVWFVTYLSFYGEESLAPRPTSKLQDHPLSAVRDYLFDYSQLPSIIASRFSICNLTTRHATVTVTHLPLW
jgi:hypothetical protein